MAKEEAQINIVAHGTRFEGKIVSPGSLRVDGQVNGDISLTGDLVVGANGEVTGNVEAQTVTVGGKSTATLPQRRSLCSRIRRRSKVTSGPPNL